ncbi:Rpp14/Pop5 family-domain-containing protein [Suillus bovinus]|uniref:Rpp14/Pop5 family-domain-containing protein n=1 Tax=Suillus bovinus TaxID=48563 RepID=UPI001B86BA43|nr:Rpp14/Pop5 family-domain-containing protein [Suillus bovinus]KAG2135193.1 Rpp14/Pop5 family-domain-containing protein [Suillus bovinus]
MTRFKNRWLLVEFIDTSTVDTSAEKETSNTRSLDGRSIYNALRDSVVTNIGDAGWGAVGMSLNVKYLSPLTNLCIIRIARDHYRIAWGVITLLTSIHDVKVIPRVIHVSGTVKHTQLSAIAHNREVIARFRTKFQNAALHHDSYDEYLARSTLEIEALHD